MVSARVNANATPGSFGANQAAQQFQRGRAIEQMAGTLGNLSDRSMDAATRFKIREERAVVRDLTTQMKVAVAQHREQLRNLKGSDAKDAFNQTNKFLTDVRKDLGKGLRLPRERALFESSFAAISGQHLEFAMRHQMQQGIAFQQQTYDASKKQIVDDMVEAALDSGNPNRAQLVENGKVELAAEIRGQSPGAPKASVDRAIKEQTIAAHLSVIKALQAKDPVEAKQYIEGFKEDFTPAVLSKLREDAERMLLPERAAAIAHKLSQPGRTYADQWAEIDALRAEDPRLASMVENQLVTQEKRKVFLERKRVEEANNQFVSAILRNPDMTDAEIRAAVPTDIDATEQLRMIDMATTRRRRRANALAAGKSDIPVDTVLFGKIHRVALTRPEEARRLLHLNLQGLRTQEAKQLEILINTTEKAQAGDVEAQKKKDMHDAVEFSVERLTTSQLKSTINRFADAVLLDESGIKADDRSYEAEQKRALNRTQLAELVQRKMDEEDKTYLTRSEVSVLAAQLYKDPPKMPEALEEVEGDKTPIENNQWSVDTGKAVEIYDANGKLLRTFHREFRAITDFEDYQEFTKEFYEKHGGGSPDLVELIGSPHGVHLQGYIQNPDIHDPQVNFWSRQYDRVFNPTTLYETLDYDIENRPAIKEWQAHLQEQGKVATWNPGKQGFDVEALQITPQKQAEVEDENLTITHNGKTYKGLRYEDEVLPDRSIKRSIFLLGTNRLIKTMVLKQ